MHGHARLAARQALLAPVTADETLKGHSFGLEQLPERSSAPESKVSTTKKKAPNYLCFDEVKKRAGRDTGDERRDTQGQGAIGAEAFESAQSAFFFARGYNPASAPNPNQIKINLMACDCFCAVRMTRARGEGSWSPRGEIRTSVSQASEIQEKRWIPA